MHSSNGSWLMGGGFMWLVWLLLVLSALFLIKYLIREEPQSIANEQALKRLNQRYANGEINEQEYLLMKQKLEKSGARDEF